MLNNFDKLQLAIESQNFFNFGRAQLQILLTSYRITIRHFHSFLRRSRVNCQPLIGYEIADSGRIGLPECGGRPLDRCRDFGIFFFTI